MFQVEKFFVFGLVLVLAGAQQRPSAEPRPSRPPRPPGSYSDFPGLLDKNPVNTNRQQPGQNKKEQTNIPNESSISRSIKHFSGPIVIPAASSSYSSLPSNIAPNTVPTQSSSFSAEPKSAKGVPVSIIAASELAQAIEKPKPKPKINPRQPLKTGTDTWTPLGYTGDGQTFEAVTRSSSQQLPYDTSASKQTIGEQILQKQQQQQQQNQQQQQQQQQQQYDIFGFPINNFQDPFADFFDPTPSFGLFAPMPAQQDPFFGSFGGDERPHFFGGSNQPSNQGGQGIGGHGPAGNMLQTMLMMQLLGGDAPDPQPRGRGRGRGRGAQAPSTPASALEQLIRLEEIRMMRNRQRSRVNRNRGLPQNQRSRSFGRGPSPTPSYVRQNPAGQAPVNTMPHENYNQATRIPRPPPPTRSSAVVLLPGSSPRRRAPAPAPARRSLHPEVLDRRNMPTTPAPSGQEPVEREGPGHQVQTAPQSNRQPPFRQRAFERRTFRSFDTQRGPSVTPYNEPLPVRDTIPGQGINAHQDPYHGNVQQYQQPNNSPMANGGQHFARTNQGQNTVPRNMQQLVNNPLFQRRLRTAGATPGANPADVRADRADLMADRADNLQAMNPLTNMLGMALASAQGQFTRGGSRAPGTGFSPLANLFGK